MSKSREREPSFHGQVLSRVSQINARTNPAIRYAFNAPAQATRNFGGLDRGLRKPNYHACRPNNPHRRHTSSETG
jgi:hypothetical protein